MIQAATSCPVATWGAVHATRLIFPEYAAMFEDVQSGPFVRGEGKKPAAADMPESATGTEKVTLARPPHTALPFEIQPE